MREHLRREMRELFALFIPAPLRSGERYTAAILRADIIAGVTVAVILIPQSMAFAIIAGLPAIFGLYAAIPGFIASLWGSSKYLATGPIAAISFLTLTSLLPLAEPGSPEFIALACLLAFLSGIMQLLMGVFRFGSVLQLIPHSAITGFTVAAAAIIVVSQIPNLLGYSVAHHQLVFHTIVDTLFGIVNASPIAFAFGIGSLIALMLLRRLPKTFPSALMIVAGSIAISFFLPLDEYGVTFISAIPAGLPSFALPSLSIEALLALLPKAAIVALVSFVSAHAAVRAAAAKTKDNERLNTNQELVGQGLANTISSFFHGFPVSGSLSRTAINVEAGARTSLAAVVTAFVTILTLLFLTPLFYYLPKAVLAAIVIMSALPLIDFKKLKETYMLSRTDGIVAYTTAAMACILKPDDAILIGIVLALVLYVRRTSWGAKVFEMGVDREWNVIRSTEFGERVETYPNVLIIRIGMSLYYANAQNITRQIERMVERRLVESEKLQAVVVECSGVNFIDITAVEVFADHVRHVREKGIEYAVIYMRPSVIDALKNTPSAPRITILHNIAEMRECYVAPGTTLVLNGSLPEMIGGIAAAPVASQK